MPAAKSPLVISAAGCLGELLRAKRLAHAWGNKWGNHERHRNRVSYYLAGLAVLVGTEGS